MSEQEVNPLEAPEMGVKRVATRSYVSRNDRGATLKIGKGEGEWSPGELLEIALLGCNALVADARLAAVLGEDFQLTGTVTGDYSQKEDRFKSFSVDLRPEINVELTPEERAKMISRTRQAVHRLCTVGHTLTQATTFDLAIDGERE